MHHKKPAIRLLDIVLAITGLAILSPLCVLLLIIGFIDNRSPVFLQTRLGKQEKPFTLIKFRSMRLNTAAVATHLVDPNCITGFGKFLRASKLDELPQLINVLRGEMSFVGPRPCLTTQTELIEARRARGIFEARPGITGLAQIRKIDMSTPVTLAEQDERMITNLSVYAYFKYIFATLMGKGSGDRVLNP